MANTAWRLAVVGAGPVGLALALHAARVMPHARIAVFDARPADADVAADARTLALSQGSVQFLERLSAWPAADAAPIEEVHVSQHAPALAWRGAPDAVRIRAADLGLAQLGAVIGYGRLLEPLQRAWLAACAAEPARLEARFGTRVAALRTVPAGVDVDAGVVETHDVAVLAEGAVSDSVDASTRAVARRALTADYAQTAWVGTVTLAGAPRGVAFERFTRGGPVALLPLPPDDDGAARAALVWCVPRDDDAVSALDATQRAAVLATLLPADAGRVVAVSALRPFALRLHVEPTLVAGRTVRIGNAAQTLHPVAGQGLNLGLRDAYELVQVLRWAGDVDAALARADWARAADRWSLVAATDFLARSFTWTLPGAATARALALAALQSLPPARSWLARRLVFGSR